ncbi:MAG: cysteine hydrolase [Chloroflexi bacterium]|nr:cysteine hydrolase [Chloroflexota bacterium]
MQVTKRGPVYDSLADIVAPKHTAFMVIDVQNDNASLKGSSALGGRDMSWIREGALPNIQLGLAEARKLGIPVIFLRNTRTADGTMESGPKLRFRARSGSSRGLASYEVEGTWGHEVLEELQPRPGERQITKFRPNAFVGTPLDLLLRGANIESVVVTGLVTQNCVLTTVGGLIHHGYYTVVLSDGVASNNPELHKAALLVMGHWCDVIATSELLTIWRATVSPSPPLKKGD